MTLWDDLKDFFDTNVDQAEQAMHQELWGYRSSWGTNKGQYITTDFEAWANPLGINSTVVDNYGGEDQGSTYYTVYKFERGNETVFIKFFGYYASYSGADYGGFRQVFPKEVTKVEYV